MKQPSNWKNNKLDRAFKDWINSVRDYLVDVSDRLTSIDKRLNARIDNLVAPNNKPSDDNEIRDARTDYDGELHGSLKARLDSDRKHTVDSFNETNESLEEANNKLTEVDNKLTRLYDEKNNTKIFYVSQERGDDTKGDGTQDNPFFSIQRAADSIPLVSAAAYYIVVEKGVYKEDVVIQNVNANNITVESYNHSTSNSASGDLPVKVRSIRIADCNAYCRVRGIQFIDYENLTPSGSTTTYMQFSRISYGVVVNCRFSENVKNKAITSIFYDGSTGRIIQSHFENQDTIAHVNFMSHFNFTEDNTGKNNRRILYVGRSIAYQQNKDVVAEQADLAFAAGQIFK